MSADAVRKTIKDKDIKFVDLRFTDPKGKWQHVTFDISMVDDDFFSDGAMFDGSSIAGWKAINESDMVLMPDTKSAVIDPFFAQPTLSIFCDILEPATGQPYARDPRSTAKAAETYLASTGIGDTAYFGPEAEFFVFDDVRWSTEQNNTGFAIDSPRARIIHRQIMMQAISATVRAPKAAIFPCRPSIPGKICDRRCSPS